MDDAVPPRVPFYERLSVVRLRSVGVWGMAKSVSQSMEDLRQELVRMKQRVERLRAEGDLENIEMLERWITDAEGVLARWDSAA